MTIDPLLITPLKRRDKVEGTLHCQSGSVGEAVRSEAIV